VSARGETAWIDVSGLPTTTFGHRDLGWWATVGFIAIEGTTLFIFIVSYFYLRRDFQHWPPYGTPAPGLVAPAIQVGLMLLSWIPMRLCDRAARRFDAAAVRRWMVVLTLFAVAFCVVRWFELTALRTRWDTNAYGSIAWLTLLTHATLLVVEACETATMTAVFLFTDPSERYFSDTSDNALYWYFMTGIWIVLAAMVYLTPYVASHP
jgi:cytochrome c oxidase subunit I+III